MLSRFIGVIAIVLALVLLVFGPAAGAPTVQKVTITLTDFKFTPGTITLKAGVEAEIVIVNKGKVEHEFMVYPAPKGKVADWDAHIMPNTYFQNMGEIKGEFEGTGAIAGTSIFEVEVKPGKTAVLIFTPNRRGTFEIGCHVEGHYEAGMKAVFVVR
ncbi:MAG TPA: cupredoxin domain-containing protein [bacterium]|jgi:uncharacterized cupredoxin-like copper-binding protein|nr:cupredoxin domain-containing protein [bacterium]